LTIERAKWHILDVIGCLIAGANAAGCQGMLNLFKQISISLCTMCQTEFPNMHHDT
jgi:hypothetical protein